jgi:glutamate-1-semialdehyde-2,1-aminomutase
VSGAPAPRDLRRSAALKARAERVIPDCSQTFSKGPTQFVQGVAPAFLARGRGSHVWDVDGNEYIDYPMALGAVILGHDDPVVTEAVVAQARDGVSFSLPHPLEVELAEALVARIPSAEMVRFCKNGSDATAAAVRVARAFTGRDVIACCGYHGWQDWFVGTTSRHRGVPEAVRRLTTTFRYNDLASLEAVFARHPGQVAAVVMEPVGVVAPAPDFLPAVRDLATRHGSLLVFDEIVTGFRFGAGGAQAYFGVVPDLACFGKALANGYPLSALVGRADVMRLFADVFFSVTFGGEAISLAAGLATLGVLDRPGAVEQLWRRGEALRDGVNTLARDAGLEGRVACVGYGPRTVISFTEAAGQASWTMKTYFQQECLKRGVLFGAGHNMSLSHDEADVARTLDVYRTVLTLLAGAWREQDLERRLEGPVVQPVFRQA